MNVASTCYRHATTYPHGKADGSNVVFSEQHIIFRHCIIKYNIHIWFVFEHISVTTITKRNGIDRYPTALLCAIN